MLDVLIGGDKLAGNLIAPTNSPARSYSASSPAHSSRSPRRPVRPCRLRPQARLPPPVSARRRAGLRSPPLRPHQLPLGDRAASPPFAIARPLPAPRCLASVCHPTASPVPRRLLVRANCCSPAALSDTELAPSLTPAVAPHTSFACCSHRARRCSPVQRASARSPTLEMLRVTRANEKSRSGRGTRRTATREKMFTLLAC